MYLYVGSIIAILCIYITVVADNIPSVTSSKQDLTQADPDITSLASFGTLKRAHISRSKTTRTSFYLRVGALREYSNRTIDKGVLSHVCVARNVTINMTLRTK